MKKPLKPFEPASSSPSMTRTTLMGRDARPPSSESFSAASAVMADQVLPLSSCEPRPVYTSPKPSSVMRFISKGSLMVHSPSTGCTS